MIKLTDELLRRSGCGVIWAASSCAVALLFCSLLSLTPLPRDLLSALLPSSYICACLIEPILRKPFRRNFERTLVFTGLSLPSIIGALGAVTIAAGVFFWNTTEADSATLSGTPQLRYLPGAIIFLFLPMLLLISLPFTLAASALTGVWINLADRLLEPHAANRDTQ